MMCRFGVGILMRDARELMQLVKERYSSCSTYQTSGIWGGITPIKQGMGSFKIYFIRPYQFRFEYDVPHPYFGSSREAAIICADGEKVYQQLSNGGQLEEPWQVESLIWAVSPLSGTTMGASDDTLGLLLPELK